MKITEHNVETGEIIERDATAKEIAQAEMDATKEAQDKVNRQALEAKKQEVLVKLGLTADEVAALLA